MEGGLCFARRFVFGTNFALSYLIFCFIMALFCVRVDGSHIDCCLGRHYNMCVVCLT